MSTSPYALGTQSLPLPPAYDNDPSWGLSSYGTDNLSGLSNPSLGDAPSYSPSWGTIGSALAAIPAGAFPTVGSQSGTTNSTLNTTQSLSGNTSGTTSGTSTAGYGDAGNAVISQLMPMISKLSSTPNLSGYEASQQGGINKQYNAEGTQVNNDLAARGLAQSPIAAAANTNIQNQRSGATTALQQQIPLLSNQLEQGNAASINAILNSLPKVGTTSGTQTGTTSQTGTSSQTGSTTQNVATKSGGGLSGLFSGIGTALAALF